eukprot:RCo012708
MGNRSSAGACCPMPMPAFSSRRHILFASSKMKLPYGLRGLITTLVPYSVAHVEKYHQWMLDPQLRELTESEALTLQEEYTMRDDWENDPQKVTFIITENDHGGRMVGDVNLFLRNEETEEDPEGALAGVQKAADGVPLTAEIDVMVAEPDARRRGIAAEAVSMMMVFAMFHLGIRSFVAKVIETNEPSLMLFQRRLGFRPFRRLPVFHEVHLRWQPAPANTSDAPDAPPCGRGCPQQCTVVHHILMGEVPLQCLKAECAVGSAEDRGVGDPSCRILPIHPLELLANERTPMRTAVLGLQEAQQTH